MFKQMGVPIIGVVENMTYFVPPDQPDKSYHLFGVGGGKQLAEENGVPLLSKVPLEMLLQDGENEGNPIVNAFPDSISAKIFSNLATSVLENVPEVI